MSMSLPTTQTAIASPARRSPLASLSVPVHPPGPGEIVVLVQWTASTPLDLHRADGGLGITAYPSLLGDGGAAGEIVAVGAGGDLKGLTVGERVMVFAFRGPKEANHQEYMTIPAFLASRIPSGLTYPEAATIPVNLVTVFHSVTKDLELELPWPIPGGGWAPRHARAPILIWGASSSVGVFALQVLRHWGYENLLAVSSARHHVYLESMGAAACFDYTQPGVEDKILEHVRDVPSPTGEGSMIPYILDCIGSVKGTLGPLTEIARRGTRVAVMLPVIVRDATIEEEPVYESEVSKVLPGQWADGVTLRGVRTHFYLEVCIPGLFLGPAHSPLRSKSFGRCAN
jgi:NADPH:quinone reductase-like Zn-dependent oxidoreductase